MKKHILLFTLSVIFFIVASICAFTCLIMASLWAIPSTEKEMYIDDSNYRELEYRVVDVNNYKFEEIYSCGEVVLSAEERKIVEKTTFLQDVTNGDKVYLTINRNY